jgi:hypothetical protein
MGPELKTGTRPAVLWLDFNTPHARDTLKMPGMLAAAANCARCMGPVSVVILCWMPSYQKHDSTKTLDEDDHDIITHLKKVGFAVQKRIRMGLTLHP